MSEDKGEQSFCQCKSGICSAVANFLNKDYTYRMKFSYYKYMRKGFQKGSQMKRTNKINVANSFMEASVN